MQLVDVSIKFLTNNWQLFLAALGPVTIMLVLRALIKRERRSASAQARHNQRAADASMVLAAIDTGLEQNQADYLNRYILDELARLTKVGSESEAIGFRLGLFMIVCSPISSLITGGNISIAGLSALQLSFATTSMGTLLGAVLMFGGWTDKAIRSTELARKIRDEVWQFTARALEYHNASPSEAWNLLTQSLEALLVADISAESAHARQKAQSLEASGQEDDDSN